MSQGDVISPILFTNLLVYFFKREYIKNVCNGEKLRHLLFAVDLLLITNNLKVAKEIFNVADLAIK